ncbi:MAG: BON domain-containing protein [Holosporales bacterium]|nr:BON domain-containing protein [Holosporales bacterium]
MKSLIVASSVIFLSGCVPVIIGGMAAGGYTAARDKKFGDSINDSKIDVAVKNRLYKISPQLFSEVSAVCDENCVLLTGAVSNPEWVSVAERETWMVDGVRVVYNNVRAGSPLSIGQVTKDNLITTSCKSTLLCTSNVRSINYKLKTSDRVVYVRGLARSEDELAIVLEKLKGVSGVKKIVSYVRVMKNERT